MKLKGSQIIVECLKREKVECIFGLPGGAVLPLFDALYDSDLRFVLVRHEQGAAHEADGFARATGKVGVCIATSGPGATNLVTGLATAYMDSIPVVALTGQVKTFLIGNDAFQEADIVGITRPITKHNYLVKDVKLLARTIREAFYIAATGRPGPVLVDLPADVTMAETEFVWPASVDIRSYKPTLEGHPRQIERAVEAIRTSKRPLLYVGGGAITSGASPELTELARIGQIPVTLTLTGLGAFPGDDPLCLGMLGMHGTPYANHAVQNCDLLIAVGARFDDRVTGRIDQFAPHAKIIHIDIDPASISKNVRVDIPIVGDAKRVLAALLKQMKPLDFKEWHKQIQTWKKKHPLKCNDDKGLRPPYILTELNRVTHGDVIVTTDVGQHQMWTAQWFCSREPRTFISSGGLGTMGFGFPASIGAQIGRPDKQVFCVSGDGSIMMMIQELATAVRYKVPVKVLIMNNGYLGMVRQWQEIFYHRRYSCSELKNPDFVKLAEGFGAAGLRITKKAEVAPTIEKALKIDGPVVIDCRIEREANVWPMVPVGAALDQMIDMA